VDVGGYPQAMAWNRTNSRVYTANAYDGTVSVIRDTTAGIAEQQPVVAGSAVLITIAPNPVRQRAVFTVAGRSRPDEELAVFDQSGRLVARVGVRAQASSQKAFVWDCRDPSGTLVPDGVYTAVLRGVGRVERARQTCTFVVLR
jgi:DNA-binding beta-propeller fold protein YncE